MKRLSSKTKGNAVECLSEIQTQQGVENERIYANLISQMRNELCAAIIEMTEGVDSVLNAAELIDGISQRLSAEVAKTMTEYTTQLFEASALQDITSQRLTNVIRMLKDLDLHLTKEDSQKEE